MFTFLKERKSDTKEQMFCDEGVIMGCELDEELG